MIINNLEQVQLQLQVVLLRVASEVSFIQIARVEIRMGIHNLSRLIADCAPGAVKEHELKSYFGKYLHLLCFALLSFLQFGELQLVGL